MIYPAGHELLPVVGVVMRLMEAHLGEPPCRVRDVTSFFPSVHCSSATNRFFLSNEHNIRPNVYKMMIIKGSRYMTFFGKIQIGNRKSIMNIFITLFPKNLVDYCSE